LATSITVSLVQVNVLGSGAAARKPSLQDALSVSDPIVEAHSSLGNCHVHWHPSLAEVCSAGWDV
jgi:hypothetical protein